MIENTFVPESETALLLQIRLLVKSGPWHLCYSLGKRIEQNLRASDFLKFLIRNIFDILFKSSLVSETLQQVKQHTILLNNPL